MASSLVRSLARSLSPGGTPRGFFIVSSEGARGTALLTYNNNNVGNIIEIAVTPHRSRAGGWTLDLTRRDDDDDTERFLRARARANAV